MASPLRPGGGVLSGATSQEEFLCARTTLLPSLKEAFYRLPEVGGIWTHDVLVLRSAAALADPSGELRPTERFWIDVVSAAMLRFPELESTPLDRDKPRRLSVKDRMLVEAKMRAVLRIAAANGTKKLVLGAWGCGAYGNPVCDVAAAWRTLLTSAPEAKDKDKAREREEEKEEDWDCLQEVVFAISNAKMARDFAHAFDPDMQVEAGPVLGGGDEDEDYDKNGEDTDADSDSELRSKIQLLETQHASARFPDLKARLGVILDELKAQLKSQGGLEDTIDDADGG